MKRYWCVALFSLLCFSESRGQGLACNASDVRIKEYSFAGSTGAKKVAMRYSNDPNRDKASLMMFGGVAVAVVGGGILLSNPNPKSDAYNDGQGALFLGGLLFAIGGVINLALYCSDRYGYSYSIIGKKNEFGIAYNFK